jgi:predicted NBD/HSP70 family sugar kinase
MSFEPIIGIDLGGTKIEGVIVTGSSNKLSVLTRKRIPTEAEHGFDHILSCVMGLILDLARELDLQPPFRLGMGMP